MTTTTQPSKRAILGSCARSAERLRKRDQSAAEAREELYAQWQDAHEKGASYREIAEASGFSRAWVIHVLRDRRRGAA